MFHQPNMPNNRASDQHCVLVFGHHQIEELVEFLLLLRRRVVNFDVDLKFLIDLNLFSGPERFSVWTNLTTECERLLYFFGFLK